MVVHQRSIRDLVRICSALYAVWLAFTPELARASCGGPMPLSTLQADADIIVLGQVTQTTEHHARFVVDTYIKGRGPHELNVTGRYSPEPNMFTSVDFLFDSGHHYLLFLTGSPPGLLRTNGCAGNREGATALTPEERAVLGQGVLPDPAIAAPTPMAANDMGSGPPTSVEPAASGQQTPQGTPGDTLPLSSEQPGPAPVLNDGLSSVN